MRPELGAPEYEEEQTQALAALSASMRPELGAPEYITIRYQPKGSMCGFNEAGAGCSGIHQLIDVLPAVIAASMRPELGAPEYRSVFRQVRRLVIVLQ